MTQYLVTGDTGFLGLHIAEVLVQRADYQVNHFGNYPTEKSANIQHLVNLEVIVGYIRNIDTVHEAMHDVDYVIHQAAMVSVSQSIIDPMATHEVNVNGTLLSIGLQSPLFDQS